MTKNPKLGTLPDGINLDDPDGVTVLLVDAYLRRQDIVDRIDDATDVRIDGAEDRRGLSKRDLARLYVDISGVDDHPADIEAGRLKGDVLRLLADEIGFFASEDQDEVVKEQTIQIWLYLTAGSVAPRMPTLPPSSDIDIDLARQNRQGNRPGRRATTLSAD